MIHLRPMNSMGVTKLEYWNTGMLEIISHPIIPLFHHSIILVFLLVGKQMGPLLQSSCRYLFPILDKSGGLFSLSFQIMEETFLIQNN
jgi:hypothetical protein